MATKCKHWWVIDSNNIGVCKFCGEKRDFGKLLRKEFSKLWGIHREQTEGKRRGRPRKQLS